MTFRQTLENFSSSRIFKESAEVIKNQKKELERLENIILDNSEDIKSECELDLEKNDRNTAEFKLRRSAIQQKLVQNIKTKILNTETLLGKILYEIDAGNDLLIRLGLETETKLDDKVCFYLSKRSYFTASNFSK